MPPITNFLDRDATHFLITLINNLIEEKTQLNIVTTIDENSTNQQIPGAAAVFHAIVAALADVGALHYEVVSTLPATGRSNIIYLVQVTDVQGTYTMHIYSGGQWRNIGTTDIDLTGYWSKIELAAMTNADVLEIWDEIAGA